MTELFMADDPNTLLVLCILSRLYFEIYKITNDSSKLKWKTGQATSMYEKQVGSVLKHWME